MFNVCRRGPASISRVFRAASSTVRIPSTKPSTLSLSLQSTTKPTLEARWLHVSSLRSQEAYAEHSEQPKQSSYPEITKFDELIEHNLVHPNVVEAITKGMGHTTMTEVQSKTINQCLQGTDIIAQAKTGTGKTLGFLLPTIQNILRTSPSLVTRQRYSKARPSDIRAIIISPTRELAEQIAVEASKLCQHTDLIVQAAVGGNSKTAMLRKTQREGCHLLVATPGRLNDLLTDTYSKIRAPGLTTLVLDEADRLLDAGFSKDIEDIIDLLPSRKEVDRQTLLFSATIPREVMSLVRRTLKPDFQFVQTVNEGDIATHDKVPQKLVVVPGIENLLPAILELSKREIAKAADGASVGGDAARPFKAIVYFNSTANVILADQVFRNLNGGDGVFGRHPLYPAELQVMHGQLTQQVRTRNSERFRRAKSALLFSTDVTARGMDFPNVTHVIQVGLPAQKEQYIHRIGRTGRGSQTGVGYIMLHECEVGAARHLLRNLPITTDTTLEAAKVDMTAEAQLPAALATTLTQIGEATKIVQRETKSKAYLAALSQTPPDRAFAMVAALNRWTRYGWGWDQPPPVNRAFAQRIGLARAPGLNFRAGGGHNDDSDADRGFTGRDRNRGFGERGFGHRGGDRGFGGRGDDRGGRGFGGRGGDRGSRDGFGRGGQDSFQDRRFGGNHADRSESLF